MSISMSTGTKPPTPPPILGEMCDVDVVLPDTLKDYLEVSKHKCYYHITDILSYKYGDNVKYFGTLCMAFAMRVKDTFVDDDTNRAMCFKIKISTPKSKYTFAGPDSEFADGFFYQKDFKGYIGTSKDDGSRSMYMGGLCAINTGRYITAQTYSQTPDSIIEPTIIEVFKNNGSETRFYLKYLIDNKNVPLKSLSNIIQYGIYNINFTMPIYYSIIDGNFIATMGPRWEDVESFRAK